MKWQIMRLVVGMGMMFGVGPLAAQDDAAQAEFPKILAQPTDESVALGQGVQLSVQATNADGYQWYRNGTVLGGQTNSTLALATVGTNEVGYYSCNVLNGSEAVPTRAASVVAYTLDSGGFTVLAVPIANPGTNGSCPGVYAGYVNYLKTVGYGWAPSTNTTVHTATDANRSDTYVTYTGKNYDTGCAQTTVTVPHPTASTKYRFSIFFPNNVPTNTYAITLSGFDP